MKVEKAAEVKSSDIQYAGERQKTRMLERTARGVDVNETPFAPYSEKGPYYWYANTGGNKATSAGRTHKKIGAGTRTTLGIKFASYAAAHAAFGSGVVNLFGLHGAPHMLQAVIVKVAGIGLTLGVYGDEAKRASGHNTGIPGKLPRRYWFGASSADLEAMSKDVWTGMKARLKGIL